jgi:O-antigen/teichoic acid export membrane protein
MNTIIKRLLRFLGFDRAVCFGIMARLWSLVAGPVTMVVIATGFSPEEQGFYYTFSSLLALQVFFELGLMFVIAQFASHEFVHLSWGAQGLIEGDPEARKRFTDLICKSVLWFGVASLLLAIILVPVGLVFFGQRGGVDFSWRLPWILAVIGTAANVFMLPFFAVIMGSGDVVMVNHREMIGAIVSSFLCWLVIVMHGGLYAAFAVHLGNLVISLSYLVKLKPELLRLAWTGQFRKERTDCKESGLSWWGEIWPMQWRIALSAGSSYLILQLFNPILFHYQGPVIAGQMGLTLTAANALLGGCMVLLSAKSPEFGKLIVVHDWPSLDRLFFKVTSQAFILSITGATTGVAFIWFLQKYYTIGQRFIPVEQAAILFGTICMQTVNTAFAIYLRAHKQEPLMVMTIFASILQGAITWYCGKHFATLGVTTGYFSVTVLFISPYVFFVWKSCRKKWHIQYTGI